MESYLEMAIRNQVEQKRLEQKHVGYMIFVLGYDLLQGKLTSFDDCPCDWAYEVCADVYNEFLESEESAQNKGEYECLRDWIENHPGTIDRFIEQNYRLM